jgi:hypothetical protein
MTPYFTPGLNAQPQAASACNPWRIENTNEDLAAGTGGVALDQ